MDRANQPIGFPVPRLIIDAKYYSHTMQAKFEKEKIHSANLNQIYVYMDNEDRKSAVRGTVDGMLLYAKTNETVVPDGQLRRSDGNTIWFRTLDLGVEFQQIRAQLDAIVELGRQFDASTELSYR